jgi:PrcB C-terminal
VATIRYGMAWLIGTVVMCAVACASAPMEDIQAQTVDVEPIEVGGQSAVEGHDMRFRIIADAAELAHTYGEIHGGQTPQPSPPAVDFRHSLILAAFLGQRPTAGYGIELGPARHTVEDSGPWLEVTVTTRRPPPGAITAQVITSPYCLVRVPRGEYRRVRFLAANDEVLAELRLD